MQKWVMKKSNKKRLQRRRNWNKAIDEGRVVYFPTTKSWYICASNEEAIKAVANAIDSGTDTEACAAFRE